VKAEATKHGMVERLIHGLGLTSAGREALDAATAAEARLAERKAACAALEAASADEAVLPALGEAVEKAEARYLEGTERLLQELLAARVAYSASADSASRRRNKAEGTLRRSADPLVAERGPVVGALQGAIERVRPYLAEADRARDILATEKTRPVLSTEREIFAALRTRVQLADRALEILPPLQECLEQVRALQLAVEVDVATVREILEETCPERGPNGESLNIIRALDGVSAPSTR